MKCCGEECTTPFCPICGLSGSPLKELLAYREGRLRLYKNKLEHYLDLCDCDPNGPYIQQDVPNIERNIHKWRRRAIAALEAIKQSEGNKP